MDSRRTGSTIGTAVSGLGQREDLEEMLSHRLPVTSSHNTLIWHQLAAIQHVKGVNLLSNGVQEHTEVLGKAKLSPAAWLTWLETCPMLQTQPFPSIDGDDGFSRRDQWHSTFQALNWKNHVEFFILFPQLANARAVQEPLCSLPSRFQQDAELKSGPGRKSVFWHPEDCHDGKGSFLIGPHHQNGPLCRVVLPNGTRTVSFQWKVTTKFVM